MRSSLIGTLILAVAATLAVGQDLPEARLQIERIVLYKHGVGYFERQGEVTGDATIPLSFKSDEMKDVLKSLFAVDQDGGRIRVPASAPFVHVDARGQTPVAQSSALSVLYRGWKRAADPPARGGGMGGEYAVWPGRPRRLSRQGCAGIQWRRERPPGSDVVSVKSKSVQYFQTTVEDRIGEAYRLLEVLAAEGVNLIAFDSVPSDAGRHQLVLYAEDAGQLRETCERKGIHLHGSGTALMVQGDDRLGALAEIHRSLLEADVSVYSSNGVADGRGGFGYLIRVRPEQSDAAARALSV